MFFKSNISNFSKATLILENGDIFPCLGIGSKGQVTGELCFNTAMTGYQEAISDPSYASQILMFTFPHIGITGVNNEDIENKKIFLNGVIFRELSNHYSNWRSLKSLNKWLIQNKVIGVTNLNTRNLTIKVRENGALKATLINGIKKNLNIKSLLKKTDYRPVKINKDYQFIKKYKDRKEEQFVLRRERSILGAVINNFNLLKNNDEILAEMHISNNELSILRDTIIEIISKTDIYKSIELKERLINKGLSEIIKRHFNTIDCIQFSLIENYANEKTNINNANKAFIDIVNIQEEWYKRKNKNLSNTT